MEENLYFLFENIWQILNAHNIFDPLLPFPYKKRFTPALELSETWLCVFVLRSIVLFSLCLDADVCFTVYFTINILE